MWAFAACLFSLHCLVYFLLLYTFCFYFFSCKSSSPVLSWDCIFCWVRAVFHQCLPCGRVRSLASPVSICFARRTEWKLPAFHWQQHFLPQDLSWLCAVCTQGRFSWPGVAEEKVFQIVFTAPLDAILISIYLLFSVLFLGLLLILFHLMGRGTICVSWRVSFTWN